MKTVSAAAAALYRHQPTVAGVLALKHPRRPIPAAAVATPGGVAKPRVAAVVVARAPVARRTAAPLTVEAMAKVLLAQVRSAPPGIAIPRQPIPAARARPLALPSAGTDWGALLRGVMARSAR